MKLQKADGIDVVHGQEISLVVFKDSATGTIAFVPVQGNHKITVDTDNPSPTGHIIEHDNGTEQVAHVTTVASAATMSILNGIRVCATASL